jgi:hypothetical protein
VCPDHSIDRPIPEAGADPRGGRFGRVEGGHRSCEHRIGFGRTGLHCLQGKVLRKVIEIKPHSAPIRTDLAGTSAQSGRRKMAIVANKGAMVE